MFLQIIHHLCCFGYRMEPVVVVDGSNVIHANAGSRRYFSVARVENVIRKLNNLGYSYKVGMKAGTYKYILHHAEEDEISDEDKKKLESLVDKLEVWLLDANQDDRWLHLAAIEFDGYILSHDQYRNEIEQWESEGRQDIVQEIKKRRVDLHFFEDAPIFDLPKVDDSAPSADPLSDEAMDLTEVETDVTSDETVDAADEAMVLIPKETVKEAEVETELDAIDSLDETHVPMLLRLREGSWREVQLPLGTPLGRVFFSECVDITSETASILGKISRKHFIITLAGDDPDRTVKEGYSLRDLESTNGTQFRGAKLGPSGVHVPPLVPRLGRDHQEWPSIYLGSRLLELRVGATLGDAVHPCFEACKCDFSTGA
jgi:hypothetical protein